jgi:hypothetical protein
MNARAKKIILLLMAAALLFGAGQVQKSLNHDRAQLGLTRAAPLENAPPLLAFTTVALGGFRGLISNYLWIRANDLQQDDKFFEAAQLADWITDLEPHFAQVWIFEAWNMTYNISIKFKDFPERWQWVQRGIKLLRDDGLRYNPNEISIYQWLAWFFQHKIGQNLDDANEYYKQQWAEDMMPFFGPNGTNFTALIHPQTPEEKTNALVFREKYKMDPAFVKKVDDEWGPLDWRLPEAEAVYWYALGLREAREHPGKVKQSDLITLRRGIYQTLLQAFHHGRLVMNPFTKSYELYPNLDLIPKVNDAYNTMYAEETDPGQKNSIQTAHRNFLKDAVYFLYENNRIAEAAKWYRYLSQKYPDKPLLVGEPNSLPSHMTLDQYAIAVVQEDIGETSQERVTSAVEGLLINSYEQLAIGQDDRAAGFKLLAAKVYENYGHNTAGHNNEKRIGLPPFADINRTVLNQLLDPQHGLPYAARAVLRTRLRLPAETNAPPLVSTNVPETNLSTNASATNSVAK